MDKQAAINLVNQTFNAPFDEALFTRFARNLLNQLDESKAFAYHGAYIADAFKDHVQQYKRLGTYTDPAGVTIDVVVVRLKKGTALDRTRTMQRNFVARYLRERDEKDAALVAYYTDSQPDWRFSLVKMEYQLEQSQKTGRLKVAETLTPARRYSFLVGQNEPNHTARQQLVPIFQDTQHNPTLAQLEAAFNIESVTKEFFQKYKNLFLDLNDALDHLVRTNKAVAAEFNRANIDPANFAKKLLGQIVFLYFLQKKGWLGVAPGQPWGSGPKNFLRRLFEDAGYSHPDSQTDSENHPDSRIHSENRPGSQTNLENHPDSRIHSENRPGSQTDSENHPDSRIHSGNHPSANFFNDVLELLFYQALAIERPHNLYPRLNCRIPFLNGGLFEPVGDYDWAGVDILLPNACFAAIFDTFDLYNFTVREDEPLDKEVAVDPEMLGKVFENLLEVTDRKSKGAFYTPREIVHYMCQESLINYLDTALNTSPPESGPNASLPLGGTEGGQTIPRQDLEALIRTGDLGLENDAAKLEGTKSYAYHLPDTIRAHAAAIDAALAEIKICDPAIGSGAFPVGLMQEIVKARTALTPYIFPNEFGNPLDRPESGIHYPLDRPDSGIYSGRAPYHFKRHAIQESIYGVDIDPGAVDIAKLRLWLSLVVDEDSYDHIQPLPNLTYKIVCGNALLNVEKNLFNQHLFNDIEKLKPQYFDATDPDTKHQLKAEIDELIDQLTSGNKTFDFEIYFSEVFHHKGGFDLVIGNPPYIGEKGNEVIFHEVAKIELGKRFYTRWMDYFYFFFHKGLDIGKKNAILSFITTNYFLTATGANKLRADLNKRTVILRLINFNELKIFESATGQHNMITILEKGYDRNSIVKNCITGHKGISTPDILLTIMSGEDKETQYYNVAQSSLYEGNDFQIRLGGYGSTSEEPVQVILEKIKDCPYLLGDVCNVIMGLVSRADRVSSSHLKKYPSLKVEKGEGIFVLTNKELEKLHLDEADYRKYVRPFYKNSDIDRYYNLEKNSSWLLYVKDEGQPIKLSKRLKLHFERFETILVKGKENFLKNEIASGFVKRWLAHGNYFVLFNPKEEEYFTQPKIVAPYRSKSNTFSYNEIPWYASQDVCFILKKNPEFGLKYILALLNSKLYYLWLYHKGKRKGETLELYVKPLSQIPIKKIPKTRQKPFVDIVDKILKQKKNNRKADVSMLEAEIDQLVYQLYGLTAEEIAIVEGQ